MGSEFRLRINRDSMALSRRIHEREQVNVFAHDGRPISLFDGGDFYQRGLSNAWLHKGRESAAGAVHRFRRSLPLEQAEARLIQIHADLSSQLSGDGFSPDQAPAVNKILQWTPELLRKQGEQFAEIYQPISILPPDQYLAIVAQLTVGCSFNSCNFCNFFKDRKFQVRSTDTFAKHLEAVKTFLGESAAIRKGIFLADGDALMTPQPLLLKAMQLLRQAWPDLPIYSFMDAFRPKAKSLEQWRELQRGGLNRVYLGLETADPDLLAFLNKPGNPELMQSECHKIKEAGLNLGLIFMVGAGGQPYAQAHFKASTALLNALHLDKHDFIFLSEFIPHPDQPYFEQAKQAGLIPLSELELQQEIMRWREALKDLPAKCVPYHLQEFIY
jgi:radical SAM superfamily enzyme YgiQ (UPF0313 family)